MFTFRPSRILLVQRKRMKFDALLATIKEKDWKPVYFLHGEESYFIDQISHLIENSALTDAEKAFNQTVVYGKEVDHIQLLDIVRRYPMMAAFQVVILKEAQDMKTLKELKSYVEQPSPTTIFVICHKHKKLNLNSAFGKALKANAVVFEAKPLYDNQVPDWVKNYAKDQHLQIKQEAAVLVSEYLGSDLAKISNEIDKLAINLGKGAEIDLSIIEKQIGISKEYNVFELQKALGARDILKANRIAQYFAANPRKNPIQMVIGALYNYFSKVYALHFLKRQSEQVILEGLRLRSAYFLKDYRRAVQVYPVSKVEHILGLLHEYDLKSKGVSFNNVGKPDGALLKEMIWKIMH